MDGEWILIVTPERLVEAAGEWKREISSIESECGQVRATVMQTAGYWNGKGGEGYRKKMISAMEDVDGLIGRVRQRPNMLLEMAGIYETSEKENMEKAGSLGNDILK